VDVVTILGLLFLVVGGALSALAAKRFADRRAFLRRSEVATGEVIALVESRESEDHTVRPRVRFQTAHGSRVTFESEAASNPASYDVGAAVRVRYRRDQPQEAEIESFGSLWGSVAVVAVLGAVFLLVGLGVLSGAIPLADPPR
jgi:hypothetical protein